MLLLSEVLNKNEGKWGIGIEYWKKIKSRGGKIKRKMYVKIELFVFVGGHNI